MSENILEAARAHFARMRDQHVEVPEWGTPGAPVRVHFNPLSLRDRQVLQSRGGKGKESRMLALAVILHARHADGRPMFQDDAPTLAAFEGGVDPGVLARIAGAILGVTESDTLEK